MQTSTRLEVGHLYTRKGLQETFGITDMTVNTGIFRPTGQDSVWLFVTANKTADRTAYVDSLVGDDLAMEGQMRRRTDPLIIEHVDRGLELLLFYRGSKNEYPNYAFRYEGPFRYVRSQDQGAARPTLFYLQRVQPSVRSGAPARLRLAQTIPEIRDSLRRFAEGAPFAAARAVTLLHQSSYWVHDAQRGDFGPAKFVAYADMDFAIYERAVAGTIQGDRFDGHVAQTSIAQVANRAFTASPALGAALRTWGEGRFGRDLFEGVDTERWKFLALPVVEGGAERPDGSSVATPARGNAFTIAADAAEVAGVFDSSNEEDARKRVVQEIICRQGQPKFRADLLRAYGGRCAITGCDAEAALEAAHIQPYLGEHTNHVQNGLLLRADLHTLFDRGFIAVDTNTHPWTVVVAPGLAGTTYGELAGRAVLLPAAEADRPSAPALDLHRARFGFR